MNWRKVFFALVIIAAAGAATVSPGRAADADYVARAVSAAPPGVASGAAVVRINQDGSMTTLQQGTNGFTCMVVPPSVPMCADANGMEFMQALMKHAPPPNKIGIAYMLQGDSGASNTDPFATAKTADNHWVVTGPHVMLLGPAAKTLGYPETSDADPTKPYMMWAGTPYEHAMIPVSTK